MYHPSMGEPGGFIEKQSLGGLTHGWTCFIPEKLSVAVEKQHSAVLRFMFTVKIK